MDETAKLIEEQKKKLPPELIEAIEGVAWEHLAEEIGKENNLKAEQIEALERETMLVLYAFESPENYIDNIINELGVSEDIALTIAESITNKIFDPILNKSSTNQVEDTHTPNLPEIAPEIHPMIEKGEKVHDVVHNSVEKPHHEPIVITTREEKEAVLKQFTAERKAVETPKSSPEVSIPDYRYPDGADPYREPRQ